MAFRQISFALAVCLAAALFLAAPAASQTTSEILGLVTDPSGAAVPGARVTATRLATNQSRVTQTSAAGDYNFPAADIGEYTVTVEQQGFQKATVRRVVVETTQKTRVDVKLQVGEVSQSVEVSAQAVTLKTDDATVGQVIENTRVTELPLNGRNLSQLAAMVAGVQYGVYTGSATGLTGFPIPGASIGVMANGQREINSNYMLDGVEAKEARTHTMIFSPSVEAVEEFKIQTSTFSAEFGQGGGAQVQITMKSGTNRLRGTLFEFLRNEKLDAENYFLNFERPGQRAPKDRLRRNQFGGVVSGPVYLPGVYNGRNRTFWAFDYEGRREVTETLERQWFPSQDFRNGNFSALLTPTINPSTGRVYRNPIQIFDPLTGDPFPGNILPATRIHPAARNLLKFLPEQQFQQNDILDYTNAAGVPLIIGQNQYFTRVDHIFNTRDKVFARVALDRSHRTDESINPNFPAFYKSQASNFASQWLRVVNATLLNEVRFGFNFADVQGRLNPRTNTDFDPDSLGIGKFRVITDNNRKFTPLETGIPSIGFTIGDPSVGIDDNSSYQIADHVTLIRNRHTFKGGVEYRFVRAWRAAGNIPRGSLTFSGLQSGYDFSSFLLGYPNTSNTGEGLPLTEPRHNRLSAYFLDEWKASPRITANIGLRWDSFGTLKDHLGNWRSLSLTETENVAGIGPVPKIVPTTPPGKQSVEPLWEYGAGVFQPRIGLAIRPANKWVIRTGAGIFANLQRMQTYTLLNLMPPLSGSNAFQSVTDGARTVNVNGVNLSTRKFRAGSPILTLDDPFPAAAFGQGGRINLLSIPWDHKQSIHGQWSFDIQRRLPFSTALTIAYVGSKTSHITNNYTNYNSPDPSSDTNINARRPWQYYWDNKLGSLGTIRMIDSGANGFYHGLQVTADKRFSRGVSFGLAYTYSKSHGEGEAGGNEAILAQDPRNRRMARGRYDFDLRQNMVAHFVWEIPAFRTAKGVTALLFQGWQTNGILSLRTGFPFSVTQGGDLNTGGTVFPDRIADGRLPDGERSRERWFDPYAFRRVSCNIASHRELCHYGSSGKGIIESPGQKNLDFSLFKNFRVGERCSVQFRSEFFNATNTPYFGAPTSISFVGNDTTVPNGPRMGEIRSIRSPMRIVQFGLKLRF